MVPVPEGELYGEGGGGDSCSRARAHPATSMAQNIAVELVTEDPTDAQPSFRLVCYGREVSEVCVTMRY
jgi:hypothetical protein